MERFERCGKEKEVLPLKYLFKAAACDVVSEYCFGTSTNYLLMENFNRPFFVAVESNVALAAWKFQIPWLGPLLDLTPPSIIAMFMPELAELWRMRRVSSCGHVYGEVTYSLSNGLRVSRKLAQMKAWM